MSWRVTSPHSSPLSAPDAAALEKFFETNVRARLAGLPVGNGKAQRRLGWLIGSGFFAFMAAHTFADSVLPDNFLGVLATFILFPVLFVACLGLALYIGRGWLLEILGETEERFVARSEMLKALAARYGVEYVSSPGGAPQAVQWLAAQGWAPARLQALSVMMAAHGGMEAALARARASGILSVDAIVIGTKAQKYTYLQRAAEMQEVEDGFHGTRHGIAFDFFEWAQTVSDAPDVRHLIIVIAAPLHLNGVTQLRSHDLGWTAPPGQAELQPVDLGARAFSAAFQVRTSDQTEARALFNPAVMERMLALAHGGKVRAVAHDETLVVSLAAAPGVNRFNLIDLKTGAWSLQTFQQAADDLAEALALTDALAHAFMLRRAAP
jgi:Protein of unknown function (DUF3137)